MATARLTPIPKWAKKALQGITYWIGHRRALYSGYPLGESALIAELCNMIYTHLATDQVLRCEVQYMEFIAGVVQPTILTSKARADIVVSRRRTIPGKLVEPEFIIEVKRAVSSNAQIDNDLRRLAAAKRNHPALTTFLIVVAEAERPSRFVNDDGLANTRTYRIPQTAQLYKVRRVCKAAHAFSNKDRAQYACLIEVSPPMPPKQLRRSSQWSAV